jgi:hypothetical protein
MSTAAARGGRSRPAAGEPTVGARRPIGIRGAAMGPGLRPGCSGRTGFALE